MSEPSKATLARRAREDRQGHAAIGKAALRLMPGLQRRLELNDAEAKILFDIVSDAIIEAIAEDDPGLERAIQLLIELEPGFMDGLQLGPVQQTDDGDDDIPF